MRNTLLISLSTLFVAGCARSVPPQDGLAVRGTVIASIGHSGLITYEASSTHTPPQPELDTAVIIPVRLASLHSWGTQHADSGSGEVMLGPDEIPLTEVGVLLTGTCPPNESDYYIRVRGSNPNARSRSIALSQANAASTGKTEETLELVLTSNYIRRVKSGDHLRVQVDVRDVFAKRANVVFEPASADNSKPSAQIRLTVDAGSTANPYRVLNSKSAVRTFSLFESNQYRAQRLEKNLPLYDIHAFPLSPDQCEYLFGDKINRNFYVLAISFQNSASASTDPKFITTGMIRISGMAIVNAGKDEGPTGAKNTFMIPVTIQPTSREHVYAILDDEEVESPRSIVFRGLKLAGTVGTALVQGFGAADAVERGFAIFTGVGIPEGEKFWADRWPGYKRNVVNFAMPNLVRVDSGNNTPAMFLFVSKRELQALVLDADLFTEVKGASAQVNDLRDGYLFKRSPRRPVESAPTFVASISIDSIEVPFFSNAGNNFSDTDFAANRFTTGFMRLGKTIELAAKTADDAEKRLADFVAAAQAATSAAGALSDADKDLRSRLSTLDTTLTESTATSGAIVSSLMGYLTDAADARDKLLATKPNESKVFALSHKAGSLALAELNALLAFRSDMTPNPFGSLREQSLTQIKATLKVEREVAEELRKDALIRSTVIRSTSPNTPGAAPAPASTPDGTADK